MPTIPALTNVDTPHEADTMALLVCQHHPDEPSAELGNALASYGHRLHTVRVYEHPHLPPDLDNIDGLVVMGGPMNVDEQAQYPWMPHEIELIQQAAQQQKPIVGVCLGAQLIAAALGGEVAPMNSPEVGWGKVKLAFPGTVDPVFASIPWETWQFHAHGQEITKLPPDATPLAGSKACRNQAFKVGLNIYAFQYHFEWTRDIIATVTGDPLFEQAGVNPQDVIKQAESYYPNYRHLGNRLAHRLALLLFPIDKRQAG